MMQLLLNEFNATFHRRAAEWLLACYITTWGLVMMHDSLLFDSLSPVYATMDAFGSEESWGLALYLLGATRMIALTINGLMRPCAHTRLLLNAFSTGMWMLVALLMLDTRQPSGQAYGCLIFVIFDLWNVTRAAEDAAKADKAAAEKIGGG